MQTGMLMKDNRYAFISTVVVTKNFSLQTMPNIEMIIERGSFLYAHLTHHVFFCIDINLESFFYTLPDMLVLYKLCTKLYIL